ncbi:MAG TPA: hypothetical protein VJS69_14695 [Candidatus Krumholzibacteria bacterium]|nr:hypothetical protein [Candidatus Krumholzibacteria bacterium]
MTNSLRRLLVTVCGVVFVAGLVLGTIYTYTARTLFNPDIFAARVADGLADPQMAQLVSEQLADEIISVRQDLIAYRPVMVGALERVVSSTPFRAVVRRAVRQAHQTLLSKHGENIALSVGDLSVVARDALAQYPQLASKIPPEALEALQSTKNWTPGKGIARVLNVAGRMRKRALVLLAIGLVAGVVGFALARRKDRFLLRAGVGLALTALVVGVSAQFGAPLLAAVVKPRFASDLVRGLWPAIVTPLALRMWILGGIGITLVAGVTSTFRRVDLLASGSAIWHVVAARPHHRGLGLLRGAFLAVVGGVSIFHPAAVLDIAVVVAAGILFFFGIQEIFSIVLDLLPEIDDAAQKKGSSLSRVITACVLALAVIGGGVWWMTREDTKAPVAGPVVMACNGHPELCDRHFNEVAFAASHNSMSGADIRDWMFPNQNAAIPQQLEDGVRGFLIDVHYGIPIGERVKTILDTEVNSMAKYEEAMGKDALAAAMRARERMVGEPTGPKDVYLAHGFCELGATKFVDCLTEMRDFLVLHPDDIVIIMVQDEGVSPADVADCFQRSGLIEMVYRGPVTKPWPTLREMVESNQRVVVMAENHWEGVPWYHGAFEVCQETPYRFLKVEEIASAKANKPGRGGTSGSLLLMNNWIETTPTPLPSNAEIVNSYDFLLKRARACKKTRKMMPNLVAVDFYKTGDLIRVVDALNGVEEPQTAAATKK